MEPTWQTQNITRKPARVEDRWGDERRTYNINTNYKIHTKFFVCQRTEAAGLWGQCGRSETTSLRSVPRPSS